MPALERRFGYDSEGSMFCAHGSDREVLEELGSAMAAVATGADRLYEVLTAAENAGFTFDSQ